MKIVIFALAVAAAQASCATATKQDAGKVGAIPGAPDWLGEGSGVFVGQHGRVLRGVGSSSDSRGPKDRRQDADSKARTQIAERLGAEVASTWAKLHPDSHATTTPNLGSAMAAAEEKQVADALKVFGQMQLSGVAIVDHFIAADGSEYALAGLDLGGIEHGLTKMMELNPAVREQIDARPGFAEMAAEEPTPEAEAKPAPAQAAEPGQQMEECRDRRSEYLRLSDSELLQKATLSGIGNCTLSDASSCANCACTSYVKVSTATWPGKGWALNPNSRGSTGCVSKICWPGYTREMCTSDLTRNAAAQLRDALRHPLDVCGLCNPTRPVTAEMILGKATR
jgi:hypothetical protein